MTQTQPMTLKMGLEIIGGLSNPSKMPWFSWSTPAHECITGRKLHLQPGTVCSKCYALKGFYMWPAAKAALARRFLALKDPAFVDAFIVVLTEKYKNTKSTYKLGRKTVKENRFRWHDSGDLASLHHLFFINEIAKQTPFLDHWLPTREIAILKAFRESGVEQAPNLQIKYSNALIGAKANNPPAGCSQTTVGRDTDKSLHQCPAPKQDGQCKNCRACWDGKDVNYHQH